MSSKRKPDPTDQMPLACDRKTLDAALRQDFVTFIQKTFNTVSPGDAYLHAPYIEAIAWHLRQCLEGKTKRLVITMPPRSLKSICASVALPAWALGRDPTSRIICASYSSDLTRKHANDCRTVLESDWYKRAFPGTRLHPNKNTEMEFMTTKRGFRLGTSVGGTLTGRGGKIIIIDDPMKPDEAMSEAKREAVKQWYDGTLYSRLDNKAEDVIILVMQRLHMDDLVGHVLEKENWVHLNMPAIAEADQVFEVGPGRFYERKEGEVLHPEREPKKVLDAIKETLGSYHFAAQYQQNPLPAGGNMVKWEWFQIYGELPTREANDRIVQSWDTASKAAELNDYSVCTTWLVKGNDYYLIDVVRERLEYPNLKKRVLKEYAKHQPSPLLIEDTGSGTSLIQELRRGGLRLIPIKPEHDKITRMSAQSAKIEAGQVWLPEKAPWLDEFKTEILQFPNGRHDDQVDSMSQFLGWLDRRKRGIRIIKMRM